MKGFASKALITVVAVSVMAVSLLSSSAKADGGIIYKNLKITNDTATVFSDTLSSSLTGWERSVGAFVGTQGLELNKHGKDTARIERKLKAEDLGYVELNVDAWLTPVTEQYFQNEQAALGSNIIIYSGSSPKDSIRLNIWTTKKSQAYKMGIYWNGFGGQGLMTSTDSSTKTATLQPGCWIHLKVRMDPDAGQISVLADNKQVLSTPYLPNNFLSLRSISLTSTLGDGSELQ